MGGGGGIHNRGRLKVTSSTLSGNSASLSGGGIYNNTADNVTIIHSTFSGNSAASGCGIENDGGDPVVTNSTFSGNSATTNGGGINNTSGTVNLTNVIIANSTSGGDCSGLVTSQSHNLDSDNTCDLTGPDDQPGVNPILGPLQDNGGPTETHALLLGSPAIDAGDDATCFFPDQCGVPRPRDGDDNGSAICDIGSYEAGFELTGPTPGTAGVDNTLEVSGAPPSRTIHFVYGVNAGSTAVPGCVAALVDIAAPQIAGTAVADASGTATLSAPAPPSAAGITVRIQAVQVDSCQVSNLVIHTFP